MHKMHSHFRQYQSEMVKKHYIAYRTKNAFVYIHPQQSKLKIHLAININELIDPSGVARDVTNIGHLGGGETEVILDKINDLNYVFGLIEQSYNKIAG